MIGFLVGTACLVGLVGVVRGGRRHGGLGRGRAFLNGFFRRLETSPSQEREIVTAWESMVESMRKTRSDLRGSRDELTSLLLDETLDAGRLDAILKAQEESLRATQATARDAIVRVHGVLDGTQRAELATMLRRRARHANHAGPYRGAHV